MQELFHHKNLIILFHNQSGILELNWMGFPTGEGFREIAVKVIEIIKRTGVKKILSDNTLWKVISPNDQGWAAMHWFPEAEKAGVTQLASVLSDNIFHVASERSIQNMAEVKCMTVRNFRDKTEAFKWLWDETTVCAEKMNRT